MPRKFWKGENKLEFEIYATIKLQYEPEVHELSPCDCRLIRNMQKKFVSREGQGTKKAVDQSLESIRQSGKRGFGLLDS